MNLYYSKLFYSTDLNFIEIIATIDYPYIYITYCTYLKIGYYMYF